MTLSKAGLTTGSARLLHAYLVRLPIRVWFCTAQTIKNVTATNIPMVEGHRLLVHGLGMGDPAQVQPGNALEIVSIAGCTAEAPRRLPLLRSGHRKPEPPACDQRFVERRPPRRKHGPHRVKSNDVEIVLGML